jgi:hypothetical protein
MLQPINVVARTRQSSSLYCVWIRSALGEDAPLVAIWIDREMGAFAQQSTSLADHQAVPCESAKEENSPPSEFQPTTEEEW